MLREYACKNPGCPESREVSTMTPDPGGPLCAACGKAMEICVYPLAPIWVGKITAKYNDRKIEGNPNQEGHFMWGKDPVTGKQECNYVESWDQQKRLCSRYGYENPKNMPNNLEVSEDGKKVQNTRGLPGSYV